MLVSVVVPVYNVEKYLEQCLESIVNQTYRNIEIILVDDGSTDGSQSIAQKFKERDGRIALVTQSNQGLSGARNSGLSICKGDFIVFVDSDDWLELDVLEKAMSVFTDQIDLVSWGYEKVFSTHRSKGATWFTQERFFDAEAVEEEMFARMVGPSTNDLKRLMSIDNFVMAWSKMYRSDIIKKQELTFAPTQQYGSEDLLFNLRYLLHCKGAYFLNITGTYYRKDNVSSLTKNHGNTLYVRLIALYDEMGHILAEHGKDSIELKMRLRHRKVISFVNVSLAICSGRNPQSQWEKYKEISKLVGLYRDDIQHFPLLALPWHWLLFFLFIRLRWSLAVFLYLQVIRRFTNR